ncbi:uroporphyrinogen-III C-methyltransferase [Exilibacterium tricleocarpae]|uniref:uroporphyrinogen-III C-methyltransferase n=1 Tax=Exilibacterium tricleocarpae TaxID=2591008 RepID=UPI0015D2577A|nr:uroporphyrinogen-III C-methyltransferase [Exilibacterium tricleocarpae]
MLTVLLLAALAGAGYWGWLWVEQERDKMTAELAQLAGQMQQQQTRLQALLTGAQEEIQSQQHNQQQQSATLERALTTMQQRLESHNKRLLSLSSTDRDDWRLAEAEYLLQLANQRLLIENDSRNAEQLLAAADTILLELQDVDLFVVREGINRDLTALKLAPKVDREGIYLRLAALAGQVQNLAVIPPNPFAERAVPAVAEESAAMPADSNWLQAVKRNFVDAFDKFSDYIRVTHHREPLRPILPPDSQSYLQQNLRFMLERAQLALMRQEQAIYTGSIQQARDWLRTHYRLASDRDGVAVQFDNELAQLQQVQVAQALPDISQSLEQLQAYIEKLHKLAPAPSPTGEGSE